LSSPSSFSRLALQSSKFRSLSNHGTSTHFATTDKKITLADLRGSLLNGLRASHHLLLGDLALCDPSRFGLPPVLKGRMGPVLERLDELAAEADGHRDAGQPLRLELLQVIQQGLELLGVP
jgi:hypothetical protein